MVRVLLQLAFLATRMLPKFDILLKIANFWKFREEIPWYPVLSWISRYPHFGHFEPGFDPSCEHGPLFNPRTFKHS